MNEIRNSFLAGIAFGLLFGFFLAIRFEMKYALIAGPISGLAFGLILYLFASSKTVKKQTQIENIDGETVIRSGGANHFKNGEAVGGKLYLLKDKLQFQSHNFNVQNHRLSINLNQIKEVSFYNALGLIPNGLEIKTTDGQTEKFVVNGRRIWKEEIEKLKSEN
ncbi:GRAM domain-containing protein [Flavobacterium sp. NRK F10]|uniref:GRAM domain-containing protein n=1 Tax=Flavobacterium sp. NRK F10 TaxID=2954931 RepID=UPI0020918D33|nr:GRAM domain-containing protein [Flavobacterium sp. NRK F10]MCO6173952.1 GRAM domain-containing protein [Flavobacterium sp. NRK F10]